MANIFKNTSLVARDASIELHGSLRAAGLIPGKHEEKFANKVGDKIKVKTRPIMTAGRHTSGPFNVSDISEGEVELAVQHRSYVKHKLTGKEKTFNVDEFTLQVVRPAMLAIAQDVDMFLTKNVLVRGFARYAVGTAGNEASTLAHLAAAWQKLFDNKGISEAQMAAGLLTSATAANFLQLDAFVKNPQTPGQNQTLQKGMFSPVYNMQLWPVQSAGTQDRGDIAGTILINGAAQSGKTITVDGFTSATGTVNAGTRLTIAGDTTVYTVVEDAAIEGNAASLVLDQALVATPSDDGVVTIKSALKENVIFNPDAVARLLIAPAPLQALPSEVASFEGISIRTTFESTTGDASSGDADYVLFDVFVGGRVLVPAGGVVMQG